MHILNILYLALELPCLFVKIFTRNMCMGIQKGLKSRQFWPVFMNQSELVL